MRTTRTSLLAAALPVALLVVGAPAAAQQVGSPLPPLIETSAQGETRVTPDRATIHVGVETRARLAAAASAENARKQRAVIDTLLKLGIPKEQISTADYSVFPEQTFEQGPTDRRPRVTGYVVRNTVRVDVRRIDQVATLIDATLAAGANAMHSLQFESSNVDEARRRAMADAVGRARGDAEALARAAGRCLGDLYELSTAETVRPLMREAMTMARAAAADQTPINPGEQTLTVMVTGRWRIGGECR